MLVNDILEKDQEARETIPLRRHEGGFTLLEILVALVLVIVLVAVLAGSFSNFVSSSRQAECVQRMKQLGVAFHAYAADHGGKLPSQLTSSANYQSPESWMNKLFPYAGSYKIMACSLSPRQDERPANSFLFNSYAALHKNPTFLDAIRMTASREPSKDVLLVDRYSRTGNNSAVDSSAQKTPITDTDPMRFPHPEPPDVGDVTLPDNAKRSVLFVDGHVEVLGLKGGEILTKNWQWPQQE